MYATPTAVDLKNIISNFSRLVASTQYLYILHNDHAVNSSS